MIHLLGAGSIGSLIAHTIRRQGHPVTLLLRQSRRRAETSKSYAITVASNFEGQEKVEVSEGYSIETSDAKMIDLGDAIKLLIVCTKAFAVAEAIRPLQERFDHNTVLVVLHNGIGVREELFKLGEGGSGLNMPPLIEGFLSHGVYSVNDRSIVHAGKGDFYLSSSSPATRTKDALQLLTELLADLHVSKLSFRDFQVKQLEKLLVNAVINPITAIQNHKNGRTSEYPQLIQGIIIESLTVLRSAYPNLPLAEADIAQTVDRVIAKTAENKSSMLQDLLAGRRTEIDYINGAICALAKRFQVDAPINTALVTLVKQKSSSLDVSEGWQNLLHTVSSTYK